LFAGVQDLAMQVVVIAIDCDDIARAIGTVLVFTRVELPVALR